MAGSPARAEQAPVAVARALRPGDEAAREVLAQLDYGEAPQVGFLGDTGTGKTTALRHFIRLYLEKSPGSVLIVDDKEMVARFDGQDRTDVEDLRAHPIDWHEGRVIVFRGDPGRGVRVDLEEVAELAWARIQHGRKTLCVFDELVAGREELTKNAQWRAGVTWVPRNFTMGRSPGIGDFWGAQSPQLVPLDPFEQSSAIVCFRLAGLGLQRLKERDYLAGGAFEVIPRLHGPPLPPAERGDFVVLRRVAALEREDLQIHGGVMAMKGNTRKTTVKALDGALPVVVVGYDFSDVAIDAMLALMIRTVERAMMSPSFVQLVSLITKLSTLH